MSGHLQARLPFGDDRPEPLLFSRLRKTLLILSCSLSLSVSGAQGRHLLLQPAEGDLTINAILDGLEPNVLEYRKSIPNLFCTERAEIVRLTPREEAGIDPSANVPWDPSHTVEVSQRRESTFRMRRLSPEGTAGVFEESRVVNTVDGRTPTRANTSEPSLAIVYGVFSNGLNILSKEGRACYGFSIHSRKKSEIQVDFVDLPENERGKECAMEEKASGKIFIDPALMRVTRIVTHVPHHQLVPGLFGSWGLVGGVRAGQACGPRVLAAARDPLSKRIGRQSPCVETDRSLCGVSTLSCRRSDRALKRAIETVPIPHQGCETSSFAGRARPFRGRHTAKASMALRS